MTTLFTLASVDVTFGEVCALLDCNLHIHSGERVALIGSNGSGKSTLLRVLHGLLIPSMGTITVDASARQAMLFQRTYMLSASVLNNMVLGLWLRGQSLKRAKSDALLALERFGLADLTMRNAKALSVGQQQRVALARALAPAPR